MLWTTDEEIGSGTSRAIIEDEARRSQAVLVLEPSLPGGAAKTSRKGCGDFELTVHGIAAHAGIDPGKGASAIHELALQIAGVTQLQDLSRGISVNVGVVSGGTRTNVVAERAQASVDVRVPTMADAAQVEPAFRALEAAAERHAARDSRRCRAAAARTIRSTSCGCTNRRGPWRPRSVVSWVKVGRAEGRTGISRPR